MIKRSSLTVCAFMILIFAAFVNAFRNHEILCVLFSALCLMAARKIVITKNNLILIVYYCVVFLEAVAFGRLKMWYFLSTILAPVAISLAAANIFQKCGTDAAIERYTRFVFSAALGMAVYGIANNLLGKGSAVDYSAYSVLYQVYQQRYSYDIWNGSTVYPTVEGMYFIPILAAAWYIATKVKGKRKWVLLAVCALSALVLIRISTRSGLLIFLICIAYSVFVTRKTKVSRKKFLTVFGIAVVILAVIAANAERILNLILNSNLFIRMVSISSSGHDTSTLGRFDRYWYVIKNMPNYLFGNMPSYQDTGSSAHNMFLDVYMKFGLIPFVLMICYFVRQVRLLLRMKNQISDGLYLLISSVMLGCTILFFIEAPTSSNLIFMNFFFFFCGMTESLYRTISCENITELRRTENENSSDHADQDEE